MMKLLLLLGWAAAGVFSLAGCHQPEKSSLTQAQAIVAARTVPESISREKSRAKAPFPADLGPAKLEPELLETYPPDIQAGYQALLRNCGDCHSAARALNHWLIEPDGNTVGERDAAVKALRKASPEVFEDPTVWRIEPMGWNLFIKRKIRRPGYKIPPLEGVNIWRFLAYDGMRRKLGPNAAQWKAHRKKLLSSFRESHPERYLELEQRGKL